MAVLAGFMALTVEEPEDSGRFRLVGAGPRWICGWSAPRRPTKPRARASHFGRSPAAVVEVVVPREEADVVADDVGAAEEKEDVAVDEKLEPRVGREFVAAAVVAAREAARVM